MAVPESTLHRVTLHRLYDPPRDRNNEVLPGAKRMNEYADATLHRVLVAAAAGGQAQEQGSAPSSISMCVSGEWVVDCVGRRMVAAGGEGDVEVRVVEVKRDAWDVKSLTLEVVSERRCARALMAWVEAAFEEHQAALNHDLGTKLYFFDHKGRGGADPRGNPFDDARGAADVRRRKAMEVANAPPHLGFTKLPFHSNKTFDNLCGPEVEVLRRRVEFFARNRAWYDAKGVPYQLGIMLSGEPGAGKSSCIRAMANYLRRHIVNVSFASIRTVTQLKNLFYSEHLQVHSEGPAGAAGESLRLHVPPSQAIYVLEEIDAVGDLVLERGPGGGGGNGSPVADELTLGDILQVLDGNLETPGRIVVITTNRPEALDRALVRPGRIDVTLRFGLATRATLRQMYAKLHDHELDPALAKRLPDRLLSPAEAAECMLRYMNEPELATAALRRAADARRPAKGGKGGKGKAAKDDTPTPTPTPAEVAGSEAADVQPATDGSQDDGEEVEVAPPAWWTDATGPLSGKPATE